jgi:hypothetical protein
VPRDVRDHPFQSLFQSSRFTVTTSCPPLVLSIRHGAVPLSLTPPPHPPTPTALCRPYIVGTRHCTSGIAPSNDIGHLHRLVNRRRLIIGVIFIFDRSVPAATVILYQRKLVVFKLKARHIKDLSLFSLPHPPLLSSSPSFPSRTLPTCKRRSDHETTPNQHSHTKSACNDL